MISGGREILLPAIGPLFTGGARTAPISPVVPMNAIAQVAGVAVTQDQFDERHSAELLSQCPHSGLAHPHQRRMDDVILLSAEVDRDLEGFQRIVATIWVSPFRHAADEVPDAAAITNSGGGGEEKEVAAGHEGIGQAVLRHLDFGLLGQRSGADVRERSDHIETVIGAQACRPFRVQLSDSGQDVEPAIHLNGVPLPIVKADGLDMLELIKSPCETG